MPLDINIFLNYNRKSRYILFMFLIGVCNAVHFICDSDLGNLYFHIKYNGKAAEICYPCLPGHNTADDFLNTLLIPNVGGLRQRRIFKFSDYIQVCGISEAFLRKYLQNCPCRELFFEFVAYLVAET